jgi:hypothetical protein
MLRSGFSQDRQAAQKTCSVCDRVFFPARMGQRVCGMTCARKVGPTDRKRERESDKKRAQALLSVKQLKARAQDAFNKFIRARDAHLPCVSCGIENPPMTPGGQWDAGHFKSRGSHPEMAFIEDNCHKQCKSCNAGAGKYPAKARTVAQHYEAELLNRIGPDRLAALNGPHPVLPLERDELIALEATYKQKLKALKEKTE